MVPSYMPGLFVSSGQYLGTYLVALPPKKMSHKTLTNFVTAGVWTYLGSLSFFLGQKKHII